MKNIILLVLLALSVNLSAQESIDFGKYQNRKNAIETKSMVALGTWSISNITLGTYQAIALPESSDKYFHRMNAFWNAINLPIAVAGYISTMKHKHTNDLDLLKKQQKKIELILLINSGLDVGYMAGGLLMNLKSSNSKNPNQNLGFGNSLMLQGSYLLVTDLVQYSLHKINKRKNFLEAEKKKIIKEF